VRKVEFAILKPPSCHNRKWSPSRATRCALTPCRAVRGTPLPVDANFGIRPLTRNHKLVRSPEGPQHPCRCSPNDYRSGRRSTRSE
jgi:hypothetical protein